MLFTTLSKFDGRDLDLVRRVLPTSSESPPDGRGSSILAKVDIRFVRLYGLDVACCYGLSCTPLNCSPTDSHRFLFPLSRVGVAIKQGRECSLDSNSGPILVSPGHSFELKIEEGARFIIVCVQRSAVLSVCQRLTAARPVTDVKFFEPAKADATGLSLLQGHLMLLYNELNALPETAELPMLNVLRDTFLTRLLAYWPNDHMPSRQVLAEDDPVTLRDKIERAVRKNPASPPDVTSLAQELGVSVRTLHRDVKREMGTSVGEVVRSIRLSMAQERLLIARASDSVVGVALACGFSNHGHFSSLYRRQFGELPSQTLSRGRAGAGVR